MFSSSSLSLTFRMTKGTHHETSYTSNHWYWGHPGHPEHPTKKTTILTTPPPPAKKTKKKTWHPPVCPSPSSWASCLDDSLHMLASKHLTFSLTSNKTWQRLSLPMMTFAMYYIFSPSRQYWYTTRQFLPLCHAGMSSFNTLQGSGNDPITHLCHQNSETLL